MSNPEPQKPTPRTPGGSAPDASSTTPGLTGGDPVADRRAKLTRLREELHIEPFGQRDDHLIPLAAAREKLDKAADAAHKALGKEAKPDQDQRPVVRVAGRVMLHRDIGKLVFMTLRDSTGDLQVAVSKNAVTEAEFKLAKLIDLGDIVTAQGRLGTTKTGEITVWVSIQSFDAILAANQKSEISNQTSQQAFGLAAKSLVPPPEKFHGLSDAELRYRQRYVDLWANPEVMKTMQLRIRIVDEIRKYLSAHGYAEVETPMLQPIHGGAAAKPFITHHNALDMRLYMRIAPELYLKRLLVGGMPRVFEINRNFRNEGISPRHNPEFTMLEAYQAFGSWETMADLVEDMICTVAQSVFGTLQIEHKDDQGNVVKTINLKRPWRRVRMTQLVEEKAGVQFAKKPWTEIDIRKLQHFAVDRYTRQFAADINSNDTTKKAVTLSLIRKWVEAIPDELARLRDPAEQLVYVYEKFIESELIDPCFVTHVPSVVIPLARENRDDPFFADVYELAINGQEISPGYTELNDPDVQERHLRHQVGDREEQQVIDEDFINALRVGMPPAGGLGLGIDRLVMMLTGAPSIRDVILFPLLKPQLQK